MVAKPIEAPKPMSRQELRQFMAVQLAEINRYVRVLARELGRDPLAERSYNDIACEWIRSYSAQFRRSWDEGHRMPAICY